MKEKITILIVDNDIKEAQLLAQFLTNHNYTIFITPAIYEDAVKAIKHHMPDAVIIYMCHAEKGSIGLKIATFIQTTYYILKLLIIEYHEQEDLHLYVDTLPYSCLVKSKDNFHEQILTTLIFSDPLIVGKLCKYKALLWKLTTLEIDSNGEPISKKGMVHHYDNLSIKLCDILYFRSGNSHIKNSTLIRLKSDINRYYVIRETIAYCLSILPLQYYAQIHEGYVISIDKITGYHLLNNFYIDKIIIPIGIHYIDVAENIINNMSSHLK